MQNRTMMLATLALTAAGLLGLAPASAQDWPQRTTIRMIVPYPPGGPSDPSGSSGPTIFGALQDQLGLKLEAGKAPRETIVVDMAEKMPIEN